MPRTMTEERLRSLLHEYGDAYYDNALWEAMSSEWRQEREQILFDAYENGVIGEIMGAMEPHKDAHR